LRETLLKVRWRLLTGAVALLAAVGVTLPAAASRVDLGQRVAEIWPNALSEMAEIWPNATDVMDVIWPNAGILDPSLAGTPEDQGNQDNQDSQSTQN